MKWRAWCRDCDKKMIDEGDTEDCPGNGRYFKCPACKIRIVVYAEKEEESHEANDQDYDESYFNEEESHGHMKED